VHNGSGSSQARNGSHAKCHFSLLVHVGHSLFILARHVCRGAEASGDAAPNVKQLAHALLAAGTKHKGNMISRAQREFFLKQVKLPLVSLEAVDKLQLNNAGGVTLSFWGEMAQRLTRINEIKRLSLSRDDGILVGPGVIVRLEHLQRLDFVLKPLIQKRLAKRLVEARVGVLHERVCLRPPSSASARVV